MEGGALLKDDFVTFAKDYVIYCNITSHIAGDKHQDLLEKTGGRGFPHLVFLDSEGNVIAKHEGPRTGTAFAETGKKAKAFLELKAKAAKGDKDAKIELLIAQIEFGHLEADEAKKQIEKLGSIGEEQQKKLDAAMAGMEVMATLKTITRDPATQTAAGKKFYEMNKAGKPAPTGDMEAQAYWILMMNYAEKEKDAETFGTALEALKAKFGSNPRAARFFEAQEKKLKALKGETGKKK